MTRRARESAGGQAARILRLVDEGGVERLAAERAIGLDVLVRLREEVERLVRSDARKALRVVAAMERLLSPAPDDAARAVVMRARSEALLFLGRYREALDAYRETTRLYAAAGERLERARVALGEIAALMYLSRFEDAMRIARRAEAVLRTHGEEVYLGRLYMNKGNLLFQTDRYREALCYYRRARRVLEPVSGEDDTVIGLRMNEAATLGSLDEPRRAEETFREAIAISMRRGRRSLAAQAEFNLANALFDQSRYQEALALLARASEVFEREDPSLGAIAEAKRAEIYLRLDMANEAALHARSALAHFQGSGMRYDAALARCTLGLALARAGSPKEGRRHLLEARRSFDRARNRVRGAAVDIQLARIFASERNWGAARAAGRAAERALETRGLVARAALARMARTEVELLAGRPAAARRLLRAVPAPHDRLARFEKIYLTGRIAEAGGDARGALSAYRRASGLAESVRASMAGEEHKIAIEEYRVEVAERAVSLLAPSFPPRAAAGARPRASAGRRRPSRAEREAFAFVEGARARALADLLAGLSWTRPAGGTARRGSGWARLEQATRELAWFVAKLERHELGGAGPGEEADRLAQEIARRERGIVALRRRILEERPAGRGAAASFGPLRVPDLVEASALLDDDEVVVEYFGARGRLFALRIERSGARVVPLEISLADLDRLATRFALQIDSVHLAGAALAPYRERLTRTAEALLAEGHAAVVAPLGPIPSGARVTVIPHGPLHRLPFGAFAGVDGPLARTAVVSWAPSFAALVSLRNRPPSRRRISLVGGSADARAPRILPEIAAVAEALPGAARELVLRPALLADEFLRYAPRARLIHMASHARFREDNPLFSAIRLADRWVHLYEILSLDLDADLVVLTGCETGAGRRFAGDEVLGLASGFLARGARSLVVSLWPLDDAAAAGFAGRFHGARAAGASPARALREATLALREENPHPYYWAPLVLIGSEPHPSPPYDEAARRGILRTVPR